MENDKKSADNSAWDKERRARWQNYRIEQLSQANNLFIVLGTAALGFLFTGLKCGETYKLDWVLFFIALSVTSGLIAMLFRLHNFRMTFRRIHKKINPNTSYPRPSLKLTRCLDCNTWFFFYLQLASFGLAAIFLIKKYISFE